MKKLLILVIVLILALVNFNPFHFRSGHIQRLDQSLYPECEEEPHLELSTSSSIVEVNQLFKIYISYHNLGMPYTYININPSGNLAFEPPIIMPCKWDDVQPTNGCTEFTLRAVSSGAVFVTAHADGEACHCDIEGNCYWYWGWAEDNGPLRISIVNEFWDLFVPISMWDRQPPSPSR